MPQLLQHSPHSDDTALDSLNCVINELGIPLVPLSILDHQRLLRDRVLQIVHYERRKPIVGFELFTLRQLLGRVSLGQVTCDLLSRCFEEVVVLVVQ